MNPYILSVLVCVAIACGMIVCALAGYRRGRQRYIADPDAKDLATGTVDAAVLSLLGLLIAFTFSSAYSRLEERRRLIIEEANAIGTAYLRLDLVSLSAQTPLRETFRKYVHSRYAVWRTAPNRKAAQDALQSSAKLQAEIWSLAVQATAGETQAQTRMLLVPALNQMIDITTTRSIIVQAHPPLLIYVLLAALALASAGISGYGMAKNPAPSYAHLLGLAVATGLSLYVILDIEYPRFGLVRLDAPHELLRQLEYQMQ